METLYEYDDFKLSKDGVLTKGAIEVPWYKDTKTKKPWIPAKRKTFVSLVKQMIREGDLDK